MARITLYSDNGISALKMLIDFKNGHSITIIQEHLLPVIFSKNRSILRYAHDFINNYYYDVDINTDI